MSFHDTQLLSDHTDMTVMTPDDWAAATALEQAGEAFVITDANGRITYVNGAFERMTGYARAEVLGQNPSILKSGHQDDAFYRDLWQTIKNGTRWSGRFINRRKDGTLFEQWATIAPIRKPEGEVLGFVSVQMDMTHQLDLERRLARAERLTSVGETIAGAAHTIKNILNTLKGSAMLIQEGLEKLTPGKLAEAWQIHQRAMTRLDHLTRQMLDFVRAAQPALEPLALNELAREVLESCRPVANAQGIALTLELEEALPLAPGDRLTLHDALLNLVTNAMEACAGQPGAGVSVSTRILNEPGWVELAVLDNGPGIPAEERDKLFQPFHTTKGHKGNGLGLAMVQKTVEVHRGVIEVESRPGQTCFRIRLPL